LEIPNKYLWCPTTANDRGSENFHACWSVSLTVWEFIGLGDRSWPNREKAPWWWSGESVIVARRGLSRSRASVLLIRAWREAGRWSIREAEEKEEGNQSLHWRNERGALEGFCRASFSFLCFVLVFVFGFVFCFCFFLLLFF
jgi:hypothetical protein